MTGRQLRDLLLNESMEAISWHYEGHVVSIWSWYNCVAAKKKSQYLLGNSFGTSALRNSQNTSTQYTKEWERQCSNLKKWYLRLSIYFWIAKCKIQYAVTVVRQWVFICLGGGLLRKAWWGMCPEGFREFLDAYKYRMVFLISLTPASSYPENVQQ